MAGTNTDNSTIVRRIYDECMNEGNAGILSEIISEEYVGPNGERGPKGFAETATALRAGFPDIRYKIEDLISSGDRVVVRWSWEGTHDGQFKNFGPTHRRVRNTAIAIYRLRDGRVIDSQLESDRVGFLQALGVTSTSAQSREVGKARQLLLFRIASVLLLIFCAGHTVGSLVGRSLGPAADAVLHSMKTVQFNFNGVERTFYDIFFAYGLIVGMFLLLSAVLAWRFSSVGANNWAEVAPLAWLLFLVQGASAALAWRCFFVGPAVLSTTAAVLLGVGAMRAPIPPRAYRRTRA